MNASCEEAVVEHKVEECSTCWLLNICPNV